MFVNYNIISLRFRYFNSHCTVTFLMLNDFDLTKKKLGTASKALVKKANSKTKQKYNENRLMPRVQKNLINTENQSQTREEKGTRLGHSLFMKRIFYLNK